MRTHSRRDVAHAWKQSFHDRRQFAALLERSADHGGLCIADGERRRSMRARTRARQRATTVKRRLLGFFGNGMTKITLPELRSRHHQTLTVTAECDGRFATKPKNQGLLCVGSR